MCLRCFLRLMRLQISYAKDGSGVSWLLDSLLLLDITPLRNKPINVGDPSGVELHWAGKLGGVTPFGIYWHEIAE